jgi:peptide/nickel transport system permease protein
MPNTDMSGIVPGVGGASAAVAVDPLIGEVAGVAGIPPASQAPEGGEAGSTGSVLRVIGRVFLENKLAVVGLVILILIVGFCFLGPFFYHSDQLSIVLRGPAPPGSCGGTFQGLPVSGPACPLGIDDQGFDVLGRLMVAGQSDIEVGFAAAILATFIGVVWGAVSGFVGGITDALMMRLVDVLLSIPYLLFIIVIATMFSPDKNELILIIAMFAWLVPARLVRGETLSLREREYVQAVKVMGGSSRRIVLRHVIPNAIGTIVVNATFQVADAILLLSALSFLNLGLHYPQTDWGFMLNTGVQYVYSGYWWLIVPAGSLIVLTVLAFNFIGDALRDALEVRLQRR